MGKINFKSLIKPKFFWSIVIVILLIATTTFHMLKEKEKSLRIHTQKQLTQTIVEKKAVEKELMETINAKEVVEEELVTEKGRTLALEKEVKGKEGQIKLILSKLEEKENQVKLTLDKLEKEITARREAEAQLIIAMREKRTLETKLKEFTEAPKTVELEKIVVKIAPVLAGRVLLVNKEHAFIVVNLGRANDLKIGDVLSVYRNDEFLGKAQIEGIKERISAATILPDWQDVEFKENDEVKMT